MTVLDNGDISYVETPAGWVVHWILALFGVAVLAAVTGAVVGFVIDFLVKEGQGMGAAGYEDHIVVCGWNATARDLVEELRTDERKLSSRVRAEMRQLVRALSQRDWEAAEGNVIGSYQHIQGGRGVNGVLVEIAGGTPELAALHAGLLPMVEMLITVTSEVATIDELPITEAANSIQIRVNATGIGDYEYAIDNRDGPYQDSNTFSNIAFGSHVLYVRDKNGCGITEERIVQDLTLEGFPKFFSPNGDGINDFWQYIPPAVSGNLIVVRIQIYNRYGLLLAQIDPNSRGWDGTFNGRSLPASDYWFRATDSANNEVSGHFSLKR